MKLLNYCYQNSLTDSFFNSYLTEFRALETGPWFQVLSKQVYDKEYSFIAFLILISAENF